LDGQKIHWLWRFSLMLKKSRPVIYTFGAVFLVIFRVGLVTVPAILNYAAHIFHASDKSFQKSMIIINYAALFPNVINRRNSRS